MPMKLFFAALAIASAGCSAANQIEPSSAGSAGATTGIPLGIGSSTVATSGTGGHPTTSSTSSGGHGTSSTTGSTVGSTTGEVCPSGEAACNGTCCPSGYGCVDQACCQTPCFDGDAGTCCSSEQECITLTNGPTVCAQTCASSSRCPATAPCCTPVTGGAAACINADPSVTACICVGPTDCDAGCCAPLTDVNGNPTGPYVCKPNDGAHYDCCYGTFTNCSGNDCCVSDGFGNEFCASPCTDSTNCTASRCQNYNFSAFATTCSGPTACGPP